MELTTALFDRVPLPAAVIRHRTRRVLGRRLRSLRPDPNQDAIQRRRSGHEAISKLAVWPGGPIRLSHGRLPLEFWQLVLGSRLHAGSALWPGSVRDIDGAEDLWCRTAADRTRIRSGQRILEIGALPGALARWARTVIPDLEITLLALDQPGRRLLAEAVDRLGPAGVRVAGSTLAEFTPSSPFDRIIAVEALAQSSNPQPVFDRLLSWLTPAGRLLIQIACHWRDSYHFESGDEHGWMLCETGDGALLPGEEFLAELSARLPLLSRWEASGEHYARTSRGWLNRLEGNWDELTRILAAAGVPRPRRTLRSWRNALLGQETMFGFREGQEWFVTQLLLGPSAPADLSLPETAASDPN